MCVTAGYDVERKNNNCGKLTNCPFSTIIEEVISQIIGMGEGWEVM